MNCKPTKKERLLSLWTEAKGICQICKIQTNEPNGNVNQFPADACRGRKYQAPDIRYYLLSSTDSNEYLLCFTCHQKNSEHNKAFKISADSYLHPGLLIELLTKSHAWCEKQKRKYSISYPHFKQRLKERYDMDIRLKEYIQLHNIPLDAIETRNRGIVGYLLIKNRMVLVVKFRHLLKTALPLDHKSTLKYLK